MFFNTFQNHGWQSMRLGKRVAAMEKQLQEIDEKLAENRTFLPRWAMIIAYYCASDIAEDSGQINKIRGSAEDELMAQREAIYEKLKQMRARLDNLRVHKNEAVPGYGN